MSKKRIFVLVIILVVQVIALLGYVEYRESILKSDTTIILKALPTDPRSIFSGDYVDIRYAISNIIKEDLVSLFDDSSATLKVHEEVYVAVKKGDSGSYAISAIAYNKSSLQKDVLVLKGKVYKTEPTIIITYGIENYFVPQNKGKIIEKSIDDVTVEVSILNSGECAIKRLFIKDKEFYSNVLK